MASASTLTRLHSRKLVQRLVGVHMQEVLFLRSVGLQLDGVVERVIARQVLGGPNFGSAAGVAGQVDRNILYEMPRGAEKALHAAGKRQAAGPGPATLRRGSQGAAVCALQSELGCLGYACGAADGIYGAKTDAAVRAFQKSAGLRADCAVGKKTRAALAARLGAAKK